MSLFSTLLLLSPAPTEASALSAKPESVSEAKQAARGERLARRHAKLDQQLNDAVEDVLNAESNVIIEFNDAVQEGVLRGSFVHNGVRHDQVLWGIVAEDWRLQRLAQAPTGRVN